MAEDQGQRALLRERLRGPPREISPRFSRSGIDRFAGVAWHPRPSGPALDDAVAWIECTIDAVHEAGDHLIVVGAVDALETREGETQPLVFFRGRYGSFAADDETSAWRHAATAI